MCALRRVFSQNRRKNAYANETVITDVSGVFGNATSGTPDIDLDDLLAPLGRFWVPFGPELDPEGVPKIVFLGIMLERLRKKGVQKRDPKKHEILIETWSQNERVWEVKTSVSLDTCCKIDVFGEA